jgi:hypothetical protein
MGAYYEASSVLLWKVRKRWASQALPSWAHQQAWDKHNFEILQVGSSRWVQNTSTGCRNILCIMQAAFCALSNMIVNLDHISSTGGISRRWRLMCFCRFIWFPDPETDLNWFGPNVHRMLRIELSNLMIMYRAHEVPAFCLTHLICMYSNTHLFAKCAFIYVLLWKTDPWNFRACTCRDLRIVHMCGFVIFRDISLEHCWYSTKYCEAPFGRVS